MLYGYQNVETLEILTEIVFLINFGQISNLGCVTHFRVAQHDHEIGARGISLQKPSVLDSGRPQWGGQPWSRLRMSPTIVSNIEDFAIFRNDTRNSLGEVYGGARVWQESCAWGRDETYKQKRARLTYGKLGVS